ncbi:MAG: hypothetical protein HC875_33025 [Anaerolineales bacterium]|nr:hypothetical protein [Anaerolineales bacterium]
MSGLQMIPLKTARYPPPFSIRLVRRRIYSPLTPARFPPEPGQITAQPCLAVIRYPPRLWPDRASGVPERFRLPPDTNPILPRHFAPPDNSLPSAWRRAENGSTTARLFPASPPGSEEATLPQEQQPDFRPPPAWEQPDFHPTVTFPIPAAQVPSKKSVDAWFLLHPRHQIRQKL